MMEMIINPAFYVKQIIKYFIASSKNCFFIVDYGNVKNCQNASCSVYR